jgi:regulator of protease activity HflC (stomatin/prohibitin superfamily)
MFDKLIDLVVTFIHDILPFKIVDQWEAGVHLKTGKFHRVVSPGLNWKGIVILLITRYSFYLRKSKLDTVILFMVFDFLEVR